MTPQKPDSTNPPSESHRHPARESAPETTDLADAFSGPDNSSGTEQSVSSQLAESPGDESLPFPIVPGYQIEATLGRGGMGVVYKARELKLGRTVALKMVSVVGNAGATGLTRFRTEARAVARLNHPNVVQIFEVGTHQGLPYFTLEFCPNGSLSDRCKLRDFSPADAARTVEAIARGVAHAHAHGIIHRDVKPGNVLLAADGTPKVTDFGLAKYLELGDDLTETGAVMGTPSYMAPEQASGEAKRADRAADVWALGAVLYRLLTGRPPFQGPKHVVLLRVIHDRPVAPRSLKAFTSLVVEIP